MFEYGGKHFEPVAKMTKAQSAKWYKIRLSSDMELRFWKPKQRPNIEPAIDYSHAGFYAASGGSKMDFFKCIETGLVYIPCENELFIFEGWRK